MPPAMPAPWSMPGSRPSRWWPGQPFPIGAQIRLGAKRDAGAWTTIVGVVGGIQASALARAPRPTLYVPFAQSPSWGMDIAVRSAGNPMALVSSVRAAIATVDAQQPVTDIMPLERMRQNEVIGVTYAAALMTMPGKQWDVRVCIPKTSSARLPAVRSRGSDAPPSSC